MRIPTNHRPRRIGRGRPAAAALLAVLALPLACTGGDSLTDPPSNDGQGTVPWSLGLNYHAINIAVGDQLELAVQPKDAAGNLMSGLPPVVYTVSDTSIKVDESGRLTAARARSNVLLVAKMQSLEGNWTIADTARVTAVEAPYAAAGIRMVPDGPEVVPANEVRGFPAFAVDAAGNALLDAAGDTIFPTTYYQASTPRKQYYVSNSWSGYGYARNLSEPTVRGTSYIFGNVYQDSVRFKVVHPNAGVLYIYRVSYSLNPSPSEMGQTDLTILKGGTVKFVTYNTSQQDDIVFDDQANVVGGNIPKVPGFPGAIVTFPNVGQYTYKSSRGFQGTITVIEP